MNKNARCYYECAIKFLLPVVEIPEVEGFKLILAQTSYYFCESGTPFNNSSSITISRDKYQMNKILEKAGIPVPKAAFISISENQPGVLAKKIANLSFPLVAKPYMGKLGNDVLCNIQTIEQLQRYVDQHVVTYDGIIIEEFHAHLNAYRVLLFKQQILGVIQRYPAHVIGNGKYNLQELIDLTNRQRVKTSDTLGEIKVDEECLIRLAELGIDLNYIPKKEESVTLCYACNATRGGTYKSISKKIDKENKRLLIQAAEKLNLNLVGFDVQCADIMRPMTASRGVIIEANDGPSVRIHQYPLEGMPVNVTKKMIRSLIFQHPFSYLNILYKNRRSAPYVRSFILALVLVVCYYGLL